MKISRIVSLLFRYGILVVLGFSISSLWQICQLDHYQIWGRFFALWIPVLYAVFSTGYMLIAEYCSRQITSSDARKSLDKRFADFLRFDDYTYLFALWILGLEISAPYVKNVFLLLSISYLALVVMKSGFFLICLSGYIRQRATQKSLSSRIPFHIQMILVLTALVVYSLISAYHMRRTSLTGDEPHYLLITHSVWHDYDMNLYNNYNNRDYTSFFWYELRPAAGDWVSDTEVISYRHKGVFPHTLIPGYVLGGQFGAVLQINIITALLLLQIFLLSYELFHSLSASFATWICMAFTVPFVVYMNQIYPEILPALLVIWVVRRIQLLPSASSLLEKRFWGNCLLLGLPIILMVLLKFRYLPLAGSLGLFLIYRLFQRHIPVKHKIRLAFVLGIFLIIGVVAVFWIDMLFLSGMLWDRITDIKYMIWLQSGYNPLFGFLGLMFDQEYGLLPYTPLYMLAFVGIGLLCRKELRSALPILGVFGFNYLIISLWSIWHAAPTPPSRYVLPFLPLLGIFLAKFFEQKRSFFKTILVRVFGISSAVRACIMTLSPEWRYNWADGTSNLVEMLSLRLSMNLTKLFPSWIRVSPVTPYLTILGIVGIGLCIYLCRLEAKNSREFLQGFRSDLIVLCVFALFMSFSFGGLLLGKILPASVLEAEDSLDIRGYGGEREPSSLDPWDNQNYLRQWKYYGWKLNGGDYLRARPKFSSLLPASKAREGVEWELEVYVRSEEPPVFKFTEDSWENLQKEGVPHEIVEDLADDLGGKEFTQEHEFLKELEDEIGAKHTAQYQELLLKSVEREERPADDPVMLVLINGQEIGKVTVSSIDWEIYNFTFLIDESGSLLEIKHFDISGSQRGLIIDKLRLY